MAGRPPKPTALHVLEGTFREDRHAERKRELRTDGEPHMPDWMSGEAAECWMREVPRMIADGLVTAADESALIQMCEWWAEWRRLGGGEDEVKMPGRIYAMGAAYKNWLTLARDFGRTPVARAKMSGSVEIPDDLAAKYGFGG